MEGIEKVVTEMHAEIKTLRNQNFEQEKKVR